MGKQSRLKRLRRLEVDRNGGFPTTKTDLERGGFQHIGYGKCKQCTQLIEWWLRPDGKRPSVPMSEKHGLEYSGDHESRLLHYANNCPNKDEATYEAKMREMRDDFKSRFDAMMEA